MTTSRAPKVWPWPAPRDDRGGAHLLPGTALPDIALPASDGSVVNLARLGGRSVVFVYPWTGRPGFADPPGWDDIAGAHGSTPQAAGFAALHAAFVAQGIRVFGLSGQDSEHHRELIGRLGLPYPLLSDAGFAFARALRLPTFMAGDTTYLRRLTLLLRDGRITRTLYPVHPPDGSAQETLDAVTADDPN